MHVRLGVANNMYPLSWGGGGGGTNGKDPNSLRAFQLTSLQVCESQKLFWTHTYDVKSGY